MTPATQRLFASHTAAAHGLLRLTLGVAFLMHGLVRLRIGPGVFAAQLATEFAKRASMLPPSFVRHFAYATPAVEAALGGLLAVGLLTLPALVLTGLWMAVLVFGSCTIQDWPAVGLQLNYAIVVALLVVGQPCDQWSLDGLIRGLRRPGGE